MVLSAFRSQCIRPFIAWYTLVRRGPCPPDYVTRAVKCKKQCLPQVGIGDWARGQAPMHSSPLVGLAGHPIKYIGGVPKNDSLLRDFHDSRDSARLFVCFSSVSRGDENSQCPWWQLPNPPTHPALG